VRPVERATFCLSLRVVSVFGDVQRNLATARSTRIFLSLATASATWRRPLRPRPRPRIFYLWRPPAQPGDCPRNWLTPGNTELGETSGTRNFLSFTSCRLCLSRRPAQPGDGPLNAYLLSLVTASATWRRPAQFVDPR